MKKISKIFIALLIMVSFIIMPQLSFAEVKQDINDGFINSEYNSNDGTTTPKKDKIQIDDYSDITNWDFATDFKIPVKVAKIVGFIVKFLRNISIIITVLVITILGIKYMLGSVAEKAEYKKGYINIIIGVVIITGIFSIVDAIFSITNMV